MLPADLDTVIEVYEDWFEKEGALFTLTNVAHSALNADRDE